MKLYEALFLLDPNLVAKDWPGLEKSIQDILKRHGAEIVYSERWPDRRLAFEIKGLKKGSYYLAYFKIKPAAVADINHDLRISERVLRSMIVHEEGMEEEMERRRNKEITAPPADIFGDERPAYGPRGRPTYRPEPREEALEETAVAVEESDEGAAEAPGER